MHYTKRPKHFATMGKEDEDEDDAIDGEMVDLFALMNSTVVELQMEMEILENREYEWDENNNNNNVEDDVKTIVKQNDCSAREDTDTETNHELPSLSDPITETINKTIATAKPASAAVDWQAMEPAKVGDQDYAPVSDYSPGKPVVVAGVKEKIIEEEKMPIHQQLYAPMTPANLGDEDYAPISDYTNTATAETIANAIARVHNNRNFAKVRR